MLLKKLEAVKKMTNMPVGTVMSQPMMRRLKSVKSVLQRAVTGEMLEMRSLLWSRSVFLVVTGPPQKP